MYGCRFHECSMCTLGKITRITFIPSQNLSIKSSIFRLNDRNTLLESTNITVHILQFPRSTISRYFHTDLESHFLHFSSSETISKGGNSMYIDSKVHFSRTCVGSIRVENVHPPATLLLTKLNYRQAKLRAAAISKQFNEQFRKLY